MGTMKGFWTKLNYFVRGEAFLHIVTMFTILTMIMQLTLILFNIYLPTWSLGVITVMVALLWEVVGKILEQKPINLLDIFWTLIGGLITILIFRIL